MTAALAASYSGAVVVEWHEAGHAVVAHALGWQVERVEVSYSRDAGCTEMTRAVADPWERLLVLVAGGLGERRSPAWDDRYAALSAGDDERAITAALGELGWPSVAPAEAEVEAIFADRAGRLRRLAGALRDRRVLAGTELAALLR